jgi:hypothetical protein
VAGNASFVCLLVAAIWAAIFLTKSPFSFEGLITLSPPLVATGTVVLIFGFLKDLVPSSNLRPPLNISIPIIWGLVCYLTVHLISTQETGATSVREGLVPMLGWSNPATLLPVMAIQVVGLTILVLLGRKQA